MKSLRDPASFPFQKNAILKNLVLSSLINRGNFLGQKNVKVSSGDAATHSPIFDSIPFDHVSPGLCLSRLFYLRFQAQQTCFLTVFSSSPKKAPPPVKLPGSLGAGSPALSQARLFGFPASRPLHSSPLLPAVFHVTILGRYSVSIPFLNFSPDGTGLSSKYYATEACYLQKDKVPRNSEVCVHTSLRSLMLQGPTQHQLPKPYSSLNTLLTCPSAHCPPTLHSKPHCPLLCSCCSHSTSLLCFPSQHN